MRGERQLLHPASRLYRQVRRENFAAHPWGVLAFVVKDVVAGDDLANRQRPVGEDSHSKLPSWYESFHYHLIIVALGELDRSVYLVATFNHAQPYGGPLA